MKTAPGDVATNDAGPTPRPGQGPCPNCGDPRAGTYCPRCGQKRETPFVPLRRLVAHVMEDTLGVDGTLPRTLAALLRPGLLTREFFALRMKRYVPPLRLYLLASFVFFLVSALFTSGANVRVGLSPETRAALEESGDSARRAPLDPATVPVLRIMPRAVQQRIVRVTEMDPVEVDRLLQREFAGSAPVAMFLLVPAVAGLLKLLYLRQRHYYSEHFVFALHLHAFAFLLLALLVPLRLDMTGAQIAFGGLATYTVLALRRVYRQGWPTTIGKFVLLLLLYAVPLTAVMLGNLFVALMMLPL